LRNYVTCLKPAIKVSIPIMLQFQFYGGIMGILVTSGLAVTIANFFIEVYSPFSFPIMTFFSAGLVNLFVPSGGGQWIVQGPIIVDAANSLNVSIPQVVTAFACGDAWTNLLQPFWTLPLLALTGLQVRDIMGYCAMICIFSFFIITFGLILFPFF